MARLHVRSRTYVVRTLSECAILTQKRCTDVRRDQPTTNAKTAGIHRNRHITWHRTTNNSTMRAFLLLCMLASAAAFFTGTPLQAGARQTAQRSSRSNMEMRARVCDLLGKRPNRQARVVTFSHKRNKKVQHVNLQTKRYYSDELGRNVKLRLSTKGMKTVTKYGSVDAAAKKFGLDLTKF